MTYPELRIRIEKEFGRKVENKDDLEDLVISIKSKLGENMDKRALAKIFEIDLTEL